MSTTHDSYLISAESAEDANSWVAAIKRALHEVFRVLRGALACITL